MFASNTACRSKSRSLRRWDNIHMVKALSSLGLGILLCGVGRLALTAWNNTALTWSLLGLGGVLLLLAGIGAAMGTDRKPETLSVSGSPAPKIHQQTHGTRAHNITAIDGGTVNFTSFEGPGIERPGDRAQASATALPTDCPQVVLGYVTEPLYKGFNTINRGTRDAIGVHLRPVESKNYRLTSETIQHLQPSSGMKTPLVLHAEHKTTGVHLKGVEAWNEFAGDVWLDKFPFEVANPGDIEAVAKMFNQVSQDMMGNQLVMELHIDYDDLAGKSYESSAKIAWGHFGNNTKEVRPGSVKLRLAQEAKA